MKPLAQFKQENNIATINLMQGNGREFAKHGDINIIVSSKCDKSKPMFVTPVTQDKEGNPVVGVYAIVNSTVKMVGEL